jgi:hypothetical protein
MLKQILRFRTALMFSLGLSLFCPGVFAQGYDAGHDGRHDGGNYSSRDSGAQVRSNVQRNGHGSQHYYNNGRWYRRGWFGWGVPVPVLSSGVLIDSLPPTYTVVVVQGNTYYYGDNTYFRQLPAGGFTVVSVPPQN